MERDLVVGCTKIWSGGTCTCGFGRWIDVVKVTLRIVKVLKYAGRRATSKPPNCVLPGTCMLSIVHWNVPFKRRLLRAF